MELNKIYNEDCLVTMGKMPDNYIDLTVTSPPYDNLRDYKGYSFDFENIAKELARVTKKGGVIVWIVNDQCSNGSESGTSFRQALFFKDVCGLNLHDTMIYQKRNFSHPEKSRYHSVFEYVFILSKGRPKTFNPICDRKNITAGCLGNLGVNTFTEKDGSKSIRKKQITKEFGMRHNVWIGNTAGQENFCKKLLHPAIMPSWLCRDLIISFSNKNDLVYDCFGGSGTTAKQSKKLERNYIASEISFEYASLAELSLKELEDEQSTIL